MDESFHAYEREVEDWHWWYRVRRDILDQLLADRLGPADGARRDGANAGGANGHARPRLLDLGCGTGGASLVLSRYGDAVALDRSPASFRLGADRPYRHRVLGSAGAPLPFADASFDVVCALDILEHLDDDAAAARELGRVCKPGGAVIVFVPAFAALWGYNDEYSHHRRRYVKRELTALVDGAGLRVERAGYFNAVLFLPTLVARSLQRLAPTATRGMEHGNRPSPFNGVLARLFRLELPLLRRRPLPFGTSAYCIATKPA